MQVYIPRETDGLDAFIHELKNVSMEDIRRNITTPGNCEEVHLRLPKFKIESSFNLVEPLRDVNTTTKTEISQLVRLSMEINELFCPVFRWELGTCSQCFLLISVG